MKTLIMFQNKPVPVYFTTDNKQPVQKVLKLLISALDNKIHNGKKALQKCLNSLISIEIEGSEAILHSKSENDSLALSLF
ncbi:hypothetical protein SAMN05661091_2130 [Paenibacillus uliginis N3/975]|uniref:Uncharacterized protein n=1 Tax=Paenibacillus uliginis N3/975 TaxID=1313296 RepID=A0A1X7H9J5_9BACL|nr:MULTISPECIES: hypothetical protein [Paenibacillus]UNK16597.1 hypothetical protein MNQ98_19100 [Paenibacillus sp. N3/727]SMF82214.1 hypothetical protein SAMN05661091_2130 [Paenibacillus uliginis N3/975]